MWKYKYVAKDDIGELLAECERLGHPDEGCFELVQVIQLDGSRFNEKRFVAVLKTNDNVE